MEQIILLLDDEDNPLAAYDDNEDNATLCTDLADSIGGLSRP